MATLFEIDKQITSLIDEETGEILDFDAFDTLTMQRDNKIENIALWIKNLTADARDYREQKEIFAVREKRAQKQADKLKSYLAFALNGEKFATARCEVGFRKTKKVNIVDDSILPAEFIRQIIKKEEHYGG